MLPLLDVATDKYSVTGVNVKAQARPRPTLAAGVASSFPPPPPPPPRRPCTAASLPPGQVEAFEEAFRRMDADGTNCVDIHEFQAFFAAGGARERPRNLAPTPRPCLPHRTCACALAPASPPSLQAAEVGASLPAPAPSQPTRSAAPARTPVSPRPRAGKIKKAPPPGMKPGGPPSGVYGPKRGGSRRKLTESESAPELGGMGAPSVRLAHRSTPPQRTPRPPPPRARVAAQLPLGAPRRPSPCPASVFSSPQSPVSLSSLARRATS